VQTQKVPFGVDPKTVLCAFYKAGNCDKGTKCKFSHDLNVGRKVEKKNLYEDSREEKMKGALFNLQFVSSNAYCYGYVIDTMDTWDEEKLRQVVLSKAGNPRTTTDVSHFRRVIFLFTNCLQIVCKHFIQAIEISKYVTLCFFAIVDANRWRS
jgi:hypothetical protein